MEGLVSRAAAEWLNVPMNTPRAPASHFTILHHPFSSTKKRGPASKFATPAKHGSQTRKMSVISTLVAQFKALPYPDEDCAGRTVIITGANTGKSFPSIPQLSSSQRKGVIPI
ncbi:hypothetical protein MAJ_05674, partial [Metarhizium majus ARSEF 297]